MNESYRLSDARGRDNNFNLIRFIAATGVIWTHAFGIPGEIDREPINRLFGITSGDIGVDAFFVLSGYLVSKSWEGKSWLEFAWARYMRIFPALWASTITLVLIVAFWFTSEPAVKFLMSRTTVSYVVRNVTILFGARLDLPGAFWNSYPNFNPPLWTLPHELHMYVILAVVGGMLGLRVRYAAALVIAGVALTIFANVLSSRVAFLADNGRFLYFFFSGSLAYLLRARIVLRTSIAAALAAAVAASVVLSRAYAVQEVVLALALPYILLWCAYVPGGLLRVWNRLGDYSYGMYIFAFPIQAALFSLGMKSWWVNFLLTMPVALMTAAFSWHFLESRALKIRLPSSLRRSATASYPAPP